MIVEYQYWVRSDRRNRIPISKETYEEFCKLSTIYHPNTITTEADTLELITRNDRNPVTPIDVVEAVPTNRRTMFVCIYGKEYKQYFLHSWNRDSVRSLLMCGFRWLHDCTDSCNPCRITSFSFNWLLHTSKTVKKAIKHLDHIPDRGIAEKIDWSRLLLDFQDG